MKKTITMLLALFTATSSHAENIDLAKQRVLEMLRKDPNHMSQAKKQLSILLSEQSRDPKLTIGQRKAEIERRKQLEAQKLLDYARQKHEEAVARRKQGLSLSTQALDRKLANEKNTLLEGNKDKPLAKPEIPPYTNGLKYPETYGRHDTFKPDYKKDKYPNRQ